MEKEMGNDCKTAVTVEGQRRCAQSPARQYAMRRLRILWDGFYVGLLSGGALLEDCGRDTADSRITIL
jgi:hypothetical protein